MSDRKGLTLARVLRWVVEVGWYVQILGFVFSVGAGVAMLFGVGGPATVPFPFDLDAEVYEVDVGALGGGARISWPSGMLAIDEPARSVEVPVHAFAIVGMIFGLVVWYQLRKIVRTLAAGEPFARENARRIRVVAGALIGWELLRGLASGVSVVVLRSALVTEGVSLRPFPDLELGVLFAGLALLVVAEVFREGGGMREEQRLTV